MKARVKLLGLLGYPYGAICTSIAAIHQTVKGLVVMPILKSVNDLKANLNTKCPKFFVLGGNDILAPNKDFGEFYSKTKGKKKEFILETCHFYFGQMGLVLKHVRGFFAQVFSESPS
jgi:alpha/beta superfamily hydrolase